MSTPESAAATVLKNVGWDGSLPIDPIHIAQRYGIEVLRDEELAGSSNSGRCVITDTGGKVIIVNPSDPASRQRFTIAHELGHALLDKEGVHERNERIYNLDNYRKNEAKMNRFAASLLMPESSVMQAFQLGKNLEEMANIFGVSQTAMRIRLVRLGVLPDV